MGMINFLIFRHSSKTSCHLTHRVSQIIQRSKFPKFTTRLFAINSDLAAASENMLMHSCTEVFTCAKSKHTSEKLCSVLSGEVPMLTKANHHVEIVFLSGSKTAQIASFLFSDNCFSAAQIAKISLPALTVASLDNHLVLHARCNC